MKFEELIDALTFDRYEVLKRAVELGKWPDGRALQKDEHASALQILIAYDKKYKTEADRIGFVPREKNAVCEHEERPENDIDPSDVIVKG